MADSLKEKLEKKRAKYQEECAWMRFLVDSYAGTGGYMGRVKQAPSGYWGRAAEAYSGFLSASSSLAGRYDSDSYLDRHPREDIEKFERRRDVAHYPNYVKPIANLIVSYLLRKPFERQDVPDEVNDWIKTSCYEEGARLRALRAAVCGWFPVVVDKPAAPAEARTAADQGDMSPYLTELLAGNLVDFYELDGELQWAKLCVSTSRQLTWDGPEQKVDRYTVWTEDEFVVYEVVVGENGDAKEVDRGTHTFGEVPIVIFRSSVSINDCVKSDSLIGDIAVEGRRLFNYMSELDEHLRSQVFALLVLATAMAPEGGKLNIGTENGLVIGPDQKNQHYFLAPPASVAETLEKRIANTIVEIYRMARVEYDRASGVESSAQSKQQNFEQTNLAISDLAKSIAEAETRLFVLVGRSLGVSEDKLKKITVIPPKSFDTEQINDEIDQVVTLLTIRGLGATFKIELLQRFVQSILPHMSSAVKATILQEIKDEVEKAEQEAAAMAADKNAAADKNTAGDAATTDAANDPGADYEETGGSPAAAAGAASGSAAGAKS